MTTRAVEASTGWSESEWVPADVLPNAGMVRWLRRYAHVVMLLDLLAVSLAGLLGVVLRFGARPQEVRGVSYGAVVALVVGSWMCFLALGRAYEPRFLGTGGEEFRRVGNASARLAALVALTCYAFRIELARGFVAVAVPVGLAFLLLGRGLARLWLYRARRAGRCQHRVVVVGDVASVRGLVRSLARDPRVPLKVVGVCVPGMHGDLRVDGGLRLPLVGSLSLVPRALVAGQADTVVVTASAGGDSDALKQLSYELEGSGVDLLAAPALLDIAGSRVSIRPLAGLPLLHLDEPELIGSRRLVKEAFDRSAAFLLLLLLTPMMLAVALVVRVTSPGPALFLQPRVGRNGAIFRVWKFRSMYVDAESRLAGLAQRNENDGILFKMRSDPRVTRAGRLLRRYSVDELPQLVNVLLGQMALVGPRPPLPSEVERYEGHTHRRLLVKPGLTGLWQVSGRSNLSWEDSVRLDLLYVESWSLGLDLAVLVRTVRAVLKGDGAY